MENNLKKIIDEKNVIARAKECQEYKHGLLAVKVKVARTAFSYWINNKRQPSGIYVARLCKALECTAQDIYDV